MVCHMPCMMHCNLGCACHLHCGLPQPGCSARVFIAAPCVQVGVSRLHNGASQKHAGCLSGYALVGMPQMSPSAAAQAMAPRTVCRCAKCPWQRCSNECRSWRHAAWYATWYLATRSSCPLLYSALSFHTCISSSASPACLSGVQACASHALQAQVLTTAVHHDWQLLAAVSCQTGTILPEWTFFARENQAWHHNHGFVCIGETSLPSAAQPASGCCGMLAAVWA